MSFEDDARDAAMQAAYDAYVNAETAEEAFQVLSLSATGQTDWDVPIVNLCMNIQERTARMALAGLLLARLDEGKTAEVLAYMAQIAKSDVEGEVGEQ